MLDIIVIRKQANIVFACFIEFWEYGSNVCRSSPKPVKFGSVL